MLLKKKYIIVLDQGTTSSRATIINKNAEIVCISQRNFTQIYPKPGWVEHNPIEILNNQKYVLFDVIIKYSIDTNQIACIGITNQRETTIIWEKRNGKPVYNAIVWKCLRTKKICEEMKKKGLEKYINYNTGLTIHPYFSSTKIKWILKNVKNAEKKANKGELLFGTIDTWLIWNLTNKKLHITDYTNASRTMLFNIRTLKWDKYLLKKMKIPKSILPIVKSSSAIYGKVILYNGDKNKIPISSVIGDQQASLYGNFCFYSGKIKNTYGTGCFSLVNIGNKPIISKNKLLTTISCGPLGEINYALEGMAFSAGSLLQWLCSKMKFVKKIEDLEYYARKVKDTNDIYIIPSFEGLGTPYWSTKINGIIFGIRNNTKIEHILRASFEAIAFQTKTLIDLIKNEFKIKIKTLYVDGGLTSNNFLMQFQSDLLNMTIKKQSFKEITSLGAAYLAGLSIGFWNSIKEIKNKVKIKKIYLPNVNKRYNQRYKNWKKILKKMIS
ncbi:MAG: glycerol kinase GlpK [Enterobacteriaceae bacterium]